MHFLFLTLSHKSIICLTPTFCGLAKVAKVAIFTKNADAENQILINHKTVSGALNRHFCQLLCVPCMSSAHTLLCFEKESKNTTLKFKATKG